MIQGAHVGVGISGEEGLQAARASDYAIAQFRFLQRLLLVHGRWSYRRISKLILYSFYKNILLQFTQFWFSFFNGYSGQSLYERWTLAMFNVLFTFVPVMVFGLQDNDIGDTMALKYPELYMSGQQKYHFNIQTFWTWAANAIFQSFIIFALCTLIFEHEVWHKNGQVNDLWSMGTLMYSCIVVIVTLKLALEARNCTRYLAGILGLSLLLWLLWMLIYSLVYLIPDLSLGPDMLYVPYNVLDSALYYLAIVLVTAVALYRDFAWKYVFRTYFPQPYHIIQELEVLQKQVVAEPVLSPITLQQRDS